MAPVRRYIAVVVAISAAAALAAVSAGSGDAACRMQAALECLGAGENDQAEQLALGLADGGTLHERAWLVVAAARQQRGDNDAAIEAYRRFVASSPSGDLRKFALSQIRHCVSSRQAADSRAPSSALSDEDLRELAKVDRKRTYTESTSHFVVNTRNAALARLIAEQAEAALSRICGFISGRDYPHVVDVYVWADRKEYRANAVDAPDFAGGSFSIAVKDGLVTRRIDLTQLDEDGDFAVIMIDRVLPHELCHLVVSDHFGDARCPLFLNEGLAMLAEWKPDNARVLLAGTALAGRAKIPLDDLIIRHRDEADPAVFYAESYSFVAYLHARLTGRQFKDLLEHVKSGCSIGDALHRAMYLPHDGDLLAKLADNWEDHAIEQAQVLRALRGTETLTFRD